MSLVDSNAFRTTSENENFPSRTHYEEQVPAFQPEFDNTVVRPRQDIARRMAPPAPKRLPKKKKKPRRSYSSAIQLSILAVVAVGLVGMYLVREERVAAATTQINKLRREIETLDLTYASRRTQFECSTNLELVRKVASERLNMGDWNEDQVSEISYNDQVVMSIDYQAACEKLLVEQNQGSNVIDITGMPENSSAVIGEVSPLLDENPLSEPVDGMNRIDGTATLPDNQETGANEADTWPQTSEEPEPFESAEGSVAIPEEGMNSEISSGE